ncbi:hypothetical protein JTB14_022943 [Gonioctena quinquepunctata]|nr:hypothetical protein JTB14_022943 [Gonioctena quinquepunctata]
MKNTMRLLNNSGIWEHAFERKIPASKYPLRRVQLQFENNAAEMNFVLLTAIVSNVLYVNVPKRVKYMTLCAEDSKHMCNRTDWKMMRLVIIDDGQLPVFAADVPQNTSKCELKLIFEDGRERDTKIWGIGHKAKEMLKCGK